jgi:hypothetical protein
MDEEDFIADGAASGNEVSAGRLFAQCAVPVLPIPLPLTSLQDLPDILSMGNPGLLGGGIGTAWSRLSRDSNGPDDAQVR